MAGEFIKRIKDAFSEDRIVEALKKVKVIDETYIKEQDVRSAINTCNEKLEKAMTTCFHAYGAATDATSTFFTIMLGHNEDVPPAAQPQITNDPSIDTGPHISPTIRSFITKYDKFDIDIDKVDRHIGEVKQRSKCLLEDIKKQALKVKCAAEQASSMFATSLSERMKVSQELEPSKSEK